MYQTNMYEGILAETVIMQGHNGDRIHAYMARPLGAGPFPGMVLLHHAPGWDEWYREATRRFAHHGYVTISPISTTGKVTERRKMWGRKCERRAASQTRR
jgi:dienelactone hydrolase